ncbi:hypothetical protein SCE1572_23705 [Sorangium cellulosum So0157-2]|uniref:Uncharacterized protein n=1 Tax=Sorangium cellulosum So0157-2 TaxID=1254432 RepID=S4XVF5_SORCE|nr:hypothetical protein SCE1572_23705 [Sorangium cellulosum So0157-2]
MAVLPPRSMRVGAPPPGGDARASRASAREGRAPSDARPTAARRARQPAKDAS